MKYEHYTCESCIRNRSVWPGQGGVHDNNALIIFKKKNIIIIINTRHNSDPKNIWFLIFIVRVVVVLQRHEIVPLPRASSAYFKTQV